MTSVDRKCKAATPSGLNPRRNEVMRRLKRPQESVRLERRSTAPPRLIT